MMLLREAEKMARKAGKGIEDLFPPFQLIRQYIRSIAGRMDKAVMFTREEVVAVREMAFAMAFADKMDSNKPAVLSAARTFLVRPEREFFVPLEKSGLPIDEEVKQRILSGKQHESPDDFSRFVFEAMREPKWGNLPDALKYDFLKSLFEKGVLLQKTAPMIVGGDFSVFRGAYSDIRRMSVSAVLRKAGISGPEIGRIRSIRDSDWMYDETVRLLNGRGYDGRHVLYAMFDAIQREESDVLSALKKKHKSLQSRQIEEQDMRRMRTIFSMIVEWQQKALAGYVGPTHSDPLWWDDGYYFVPLEKYRFIH